MSMLDIWLGILQGFRVTASVTLYGLLFAIPFGLVFGVAQYLTTGPARLIVTAIIEFWRSSAVIILLFVFYYALPVVGLMFSAMTRQRHGAGPEHRRLCQPGRQGGTAIARPGAEGGRTGAGAVASHHPALIELPQALVAMSPTFINQIIQLVKATSLVTLTDMTFRAKEISQIEYDPEMIKEVLDVMTGLANEGMTMICVTHEMGFAREVADQVVFMDQGSIVEQASPSTFFTTPAHPRARSFLNTLLH